MRAARWLLPLVALLSLCACSGAPAQVDERDGGGDGGGTQTQPDGAVPAQPCAATSCAAASATCGELVLCDGSRVDCGACAAPATCGGAGTANVCGVADSRADGVCSNGWCWKNPWPQGNALLDVHGTAADDVWAAGDHGTLLHWNGARWTASDAGTRESLRGVFATRRDEAWTVLQRSPPSGPGAVLRFDGARWTEATSAAGFRPTAVWASSSKDVWVAGATGATGATLRFDGGTWSTPAATGQNGWQERLWGTDGGVVYGAGPNGLQRSFGDSYWSPVGAGSSGLNEVWGSSASNVWAAGTGQQLWRFDGGSWTKDDALSAGHHWSALFGSAANDVWMFGRRSGPPYDNPVFHFDGQAWTQFTDAPALKAAATSAWGASASDVWAVGPAGWMLRYDGTRWSAFSKGSDEPSFTSVVNTGPGAALVFDGTAKVRRFTAEGVSTLEAPGTGARLEVAFGTGADDVWASGSVSGSDVLHWDGRAWRKADTALWGVSAIHGTAPNRYAMAGGAGTLWRYDETGWRMERLSALTMYAGVFVTPSGEAWAVGSRGAIARSTRSSGGWSAFASPVTSDLRAVWGATDSDIWAVGDEGFLRFDGARWHIATTSLPSTLRFHALFGTSASDVYALGEDGVSGALAHYDGTAWSLVDPGTHHVLHGMSGRSAGEAWLVGESGTVLRRGP